MMDNGAPTNLRCEYLVDPIGLDERRPRLSWILSDPRRGARQTAYQVAAARSAAELARGEGYLWDTGKVAGDRSLHVPYAGPPLGSGERVYWRVRTWDADDKPSPWSEPAFWEMGLLDRSEWVGEWIGSHVVGGKQTSAPCPYLRKAFTVPKPVASARLYVTALGLYACEINGRGVTGDVFRPGWTDYGRRVQYQAYDVTTLLRPGENAVGALLGDGWYCGHVAWAGRQLYGDRPKLLAQLRIDFTDGSSGLIATDGAWRYSLGPILESDILMGESYDARREMPGWSQSPFDDAGWLPVPVFDDPGIALVAQCGPSVRRIEEIKPVAPPAVRGAPHEQKRWVFDLGQNIAGRVRLRLSGRAGETVRLRFAEMLQPSGEIYTDNLRAARATDHYTLKGGGEETYEPFFTFHGFRYVELLAGAEVNPTVDSVTGIVLHSDTPPAGAFECSDPLVNRLQSNIRWGQKGNFLDVPTDCPQRDERLGWTGDAQVFIRTACFNMDVAAFFTKWQQDLADAQAESGAFPPVAPRPDAATRNPDGGPAWADAGVICPWTVYLCFGDTRLLEQHYGSLCRFLDYLEQTSRDLIRCDSRDNYHAYGDWLAVDAPDPGRAPTPKDLIGTAYFAHVAALMAKIARVLGKADDADRFGDLRRRVERAFNREFVSPGGRVLGHTQTGYLLALAFDLLPEDKRPAALEFLVNDIERRGSHLSTGFVGTPLLCPVLSRFGRTDLAYKLLLQDTYPSWLYTVKQGATTMWERWNSYTKERGFGSAGMNSFNHYAYGAIGEWMYGVIGGIDTDPERPAFKHILVRPQPGGGLTHARASLVSMYGLIESAWRIEDQKFKLDVAVPANTGATIHVPAPDHSSVSESGKPVTDDENIRFVAMQGGAAIFEVAAGTYSFEAPSSGDQVTRL